MNLMLIFAVVPWALVANAGRIVIDQPSDAYFVSLQVALVLIQIGACAALWWGYRKSEREYERARAARRASGLWI